MVRETAATSKIFHAPQALNPAWASLILLIVYVRTLITAVTWNIYSPSLNEASDPFRRRARVAKFRGFVIHRSGSS